MIRDEYLREGLAKLGDELVAMAATFDRLRIEVDCVDDVGKAVVDQRERDGSRVCVLRWKDGFDGR